jgi:hypothetical protein
MGIGSICASMLMHFGLNAPSAICLLLGDEFAIVLKGSLKVI